MMDSFEFTKFAGSVLAALLLIVGAKTAIEIAMSGHGHVENGYTLPAPKAEAAAAKGGEAAPAGFDAAKVVAMIGAAKPDNGAAVFKKCAACHTDTKDGANKVGPALWGVVGRPKASHAGFSYSDAMKAKGGNWTFDELAHFVHGPGAYVKGTKMAFAGISDPGDLADLLAYLNKQSDKPLPAPGK